jgi:hypothetical protein
VPLSEHSDLAPLAVRHGEVATYHPDDEVWRPRQPMGADCETESLDLAMSSSSSMGTDETWPRGEQVCRRPPGWHWQHFWGGRGRHRADGLDLVPLDE